MLSATFEGTTIEHLRGSTFIKMAINGTKTHGNSKFGKILGTDPCFDFVGLKKQNILV